MWLTALTDTLVRKLLQYVLNLAGNTVGIYLTEYRMTEFSILLVPLGRTRTEMHKICLVMRSLT